MNEEMVVQILTEYISDQFPKDCKACGRRYESLADYLKNTQHIGQPISIDADSGNWQLKNQIGTFSMANCSCGSSLTITSLKMDVVTMFRLMNWAKSEIKTRDISMGDLLEDIRTKIDKRVLGDEYQEK